MAFPNPAVPGAFGHPIEPGMVPCVEALVSAEGGDFLIELEEVLITHDRHEALSS